MSRFIQVIDGAENGVYDTFSASESEFARLFPHGSDIAFSKDLFRRDDADELSEVLERLWTNRVPKTQAIGIHGTLFYGMEDKHAYYPTLRDVGAINPNGSQLRPGVAATGQQRPP